MAPAHRTRPAPFPPTRGLSAAITRYFRNNPTDCRSTGVARNCTLSRARFFPCSSRASSHGSPVIPIGRSASSGFSLVEVLAVLVLLGVLASLAVPSMHETVRRARLRSVLDQLTTDLYQARAQAVRSGHHLRFRFEAASGGCARGYVLEDPELNLRLREVDLEEEAPGVCLNVSGSEVLRVDARGMLVGASRKVRARSHHLADSVSISLIGRVYRWH